MNRYIITGPPSSGKTTLIELLKKHHDVKEEAARKIIKEQLELKSDKVPWLNNYEFSKLVHEQQIKDFNATNNHICFYDRGLPDVMAYLAYHEQPEYLKEFTTTARQYRYHKKVFLLPPWKEIYDKDYERKENFDDACQIYQLLKTTYLQLSHQIIEVPLVNPQERIKFILQQT